MSAASTKTQSVNIRSWDIIIKSNYHQDRLIFRWSIAIWKKLIRNTNLIFNISNLLHDCRHIDHFLSTNRKYQIIAWKALTFSGESSYEKKNEIAPVRGKILRNSAKCFTFHWVKRGYLGTTRKPRKLKVDNFFWPNITATGSMQGHGRNNWENLPSNFQACSWREEKARKMQAFSFILVCCRLVHGGSTKRWNCYFWIVNSHFFWEI